MSSTGSTYQENSRDRPQRRIVPGIDHELALKRLDDAVRFVERIESHLRSMEAK
jgi:hypothetical protein